MTRHQFQGSGGYDECYATWGPDDKDMNLRLQRLGFRGVQIPMRYLDGVPHNDRMRFKGYAVPIAPGDYEWETVAARPVTVANFGRVGCAIVQRNWAEHHVLALMPTRIFGIGLHKTGTTSLHTALRILGFDSAHWKSVGWARSVYTEMLALKASPSLERHYAASDLPIPLLYRELDAAYPRSKFIFTTRTEDSWIESVRNHFARAGNKYRAAWDTDGFTHVLHERLYGRRSFEEDTFRARFRQHTADVLAYFTDRPEDLLIMNMSTLADPWVPLCQFLGRHHPGVSYPRRRHPPSIGA